MITAIKRNKDGSLQKGSEKQFSEHQWARMKIMFADKLRWEQIKEKPKSRKSVTEKSNKSSIKEVEKHHKLAPTQDEIEDAMAEVLITESKQSWSELSEEEAKQLEEEFKDAEQIEMTPIIKRVKEEPKE